MRAGGQGSFEKRYESAGYTRYDVSGQIAGILGRVVISILSVVYGEVIFKDSSRSIHTGNSVPVSGAS